MAQSQDCLAYRTLGELVCHSSHREVEANDHGSRSAGLSNGLPELKVGLASSQS